VQDDFSWHISMRRHRSVKDHTITWIKHTSKKEEKGKAFKIKE
jgi:hypothetical protein